MSMNLWRHGVVHVGAGGGGPYAKMINIPDYTNLLSAGEKTLDWNTIVNEGDGVTISGTDILGDNAGVYLTFVQGRMQSANQHRMALENISGIDVYFASYPYSSGGILRHHGGYVGNAKINVSPGNLVARTKVYTQNLIGPPSVDTYASMNAVWMGATRKAAFVRGTGDVSTPTGAATQLPLTTIVEDNDSHSLSGGDLIATRTGWALINFGGCKIGGTGAHWYITVNGNLRGFSGEMWDSSYGAHFPSHSFVYLTAGDAIRLWKKNGSTTNMRHDLSYVNIMYLNAGEVKAGWRLNAYYQTSGTIAESIQTDLNTRYDLGVAALDTAGDYTKVGGVDIPGEFVIPSGQAGTYLISNTRAALPIISGSAQWDHGRHIHHYIDINGVRVSRGTLDHSAYTNNTQALWAGISHMVVADLVAGDRVTCKWMIPLNGITEVGKTPVFHHTELSNAAFLVKIA